MLESFIISGTQRFFLSSCLAFYFVCKHIIFRRRNYFLKFHLTFIQEKLKQQLANKKSSKQQKSTEHQINIRKLNKYFFFPPSQTNKNRINFLLCLYKKKEVFSLVLIQVISLDNKKKTIIFISYKFLYFNISKETQTRRKSKSIFALKTNQHI